MGRLSILQDCDASAWCEELPSWVPNWNKPRSDHHDFLGSFGGGRDIEGIGSAMASIVSDVLKVNGVICETVKSCSAVAS